MSRVNFLSYNNYITDTLYQWDINQELVVIGLNVANAPEIHFSNVNMDRAIVRKATNEGHIVRVMIPNSLLQEPYTIHAHIGVRNGDTFNVIEKIDIPIIERPRPFDYTIEDTDEEIYSFNSLEYQLSDKLDAVTFDEAMIEIKTDSSGVVRDTAGEYIRSLEERIRALEIAINV